MISTRICTWAWLKANRRRHKRLITAIHQPRQTQETVLADILHRNRDCRFGQDHGFDQINNVTQFQQRVPISEYEDYAPAIDGICRGKQHVLTSEPVRRLVPTSGSNGPMKLIPWTDTLSRQFNDAIGTWVVDLYNRFPKLKNGQSYWSISPAMTVPHQPQSVVPIGFADDTQYLGRWMARLINRMMVVPNNVRHITEMPVFQYVTLLLLLHARALRLISVWHPSFLSLLLQTFETYRERLLRDLHDGTISPPGELPSMIKHTIASRIRPQPCRVARIQTGTLWPDLQLVSCWTDGAAGEAAELLQASLPGATIQPKGLISTEAFVSLPWGNAHPLAINSHFFEFMDDAGKVYLADQIQVGCRYSVIVTTGGGLYRYRMHDMVEVNQIVKQTPSIRFVARDNCICDYCGEKLSEPFVAIAIRQVVTFACQFVMLAIDPTASPSGYVLFVETDHPIPPDLAERLDQALCANPHYDYCRKLGQLKQVSIRVIAANAQAIYMEHVRKNRTTLGQIKPTFLSSDPNWIHVFPD